MITTALNFTIYVVAVILLFIILTNLANWGDNVKNYKFINKPKNFIGTYLQYVFLGITISFIIYYPLCGWFSHISIHLFWLMPIIFSVIGSFFILYYYIVLNKSKNEFLALKSTLYDDMDCDQMNTILSNKETQWEIEHKYSLSVFKNLIPLCIICMSILLVYRIGEAIYN